jgi:NADPH:quinone reductase-like Zn-dependent oxidoreductase
MRLLTPLSVTPPEIGSSGASPAEPQRDYLIIGRQDTVYRTPDGIPDDIASTLTVAGLTASAALSVIGVDSADTVLIGDAAEAVGVFAVN